MGVHRTKQEKIAAHARREQTYQWSAGTAAPAKPSASAEQKSNMLLIKEIPSIPALRYDVLRTMLALTTVLVIIAIAYLKLGN